MGWGGVRVGAADVVLGRNMRLGVFERGVGVEGVGDGGGGG